MKNPKAIIFGVSGQDGFYLSSLLNREGIEVIGSSRTQGIKGDVGNPVFVQSLIEEHTPDYIFHLAADSTTRHSSLVQNYNSISTGTDNILESCRIYSPECKIFLSGSAVQFQNQGIPIDEKTPFFPSSPYSLARIHSTYAARYYREFFGMKIYVGFLFNHDSPLRTERHINQKIVKTIQRIHSGEKIKLEVGSIEVKKEFSFAGDIVEAIWALMGQDKIFECVIGSGESHPIQKWIELCFNEVDMKWEDHTEIIEDFVPEYWNLVSNPKVIREIGWSPKNDIYSLSKMMMGRFNEKN
jgi:GDPmannose 4,6-dehydratase